MGFSNVALLTGGCGFWMAVVCKVTVSDWVL